MHILPATENDDEYYVLRQLQRQTDNFVVLEGYTVKNTKVFIVCTYMVYMMYSFQKNAHCQYSFILHFKA